MAKLTEDESNKKLAVGNAYFLSAMFVVNNYWLSFNLFQLRSGR